MVVTSSVADMYLTAAGRGTTRVPFTLYKKITLVIFNFDLFYLSHFLLVHTYFVIFFIGHTFYWFTLYEKVTLIFLFWSFFHWPHFLLVNTLWKSYSCYCILIFFFIGHTLYWFTLYEKVTLLFYLYLIWYDHVIFWRKVF